MLKKNLIDRYEEKKRNLTQGDELPPGVQKMVKVYLAVKRRIQPGDKMAGRHGNKGVISKIAPVEDMPYMADGKTLDICLKSFGCSIKNEYWSSIRSSFRLGSKRLGDRIDEMLKENQKISEVRKFLDKIYNTSSGKNEDIKSLKDNEVKELADI